MKQKQYTDGTPSREVEEDWESSDDSVHENLTHCRDQVNDLIDSINVIQLAVLCEEENKMYGWESSVAMALISVSERLKQLEKDIKCNQ